MLSGAKHLWLFARNALGKCDPEIESLASLRMASFLSLRRLRRANFHAFRLQLPSQFARELDRARCVAVNTNGFATHGHVAAFHRAHFPFAQHPQHPLSRFFGVVE